MGCVLVQLINNTLIDTCFEREYVSILILKWSSNMQGDINGFKTLILKENKSAFYVHCFAHQLQLTLVAIAKNHINIAEFFYVVSNLVTIVGCSCKRWDALWDAQFAKIKEDLENGVCRSG